MWSMMVFTPHQENTVKEDGPVMSGPGTVKTATVESRTTSLSQPKGNEPSELLTNEIIVDKGKGLSQENKYAPSCFFSFLVSP